ncbi:MAG: AAA family ATPase [Planctomycetota bacterium]
MPATKPPPPPPPATPARRAVSPGRKEKVKPAKAYTIEPWTGDGEGEKIVIYSPSGMGKTTLAAMAPKPAFMGFDDGGRRIKHPKTGQDLNRIPNVEDFEDVRAVCGQPEIFTGPGYETLVIDTATMLEQLIEQHVLATVPKTDGGYVSNLKAYGWNDGYKHLLDAFRLLLADLDRLVRAGVNVVLLAQETGHKMDNTEGADYRKAGPHLTHNNQASLVLELIAWADHVFRIGFEDTYVHTTDANQKVGKAVGEDKTRVIRAANARSYFAKSRTLDEDLISFESKTDDSLWQFLFPAPGASTPE